MAKNYDFGNLRMLVIDDCKFMLNMLGRMLDELGVGYIKSANDGIEAWKMLKEKEFDVLLCDWEMQPEDGPTFVRKLRLEADSPARYVPIIMLTGYTEKTKVMSARDFGITEFLAKPVSARSLHSRIVDIIESPRPFVRTASFLDLAGGASTCPVSTVRNEGYPAWTRLKSSRRTRSPGNWQSETYG